MATKGVTMKFFDQIKKRFTKKKSKEAVSPRAPRVEKSAKDLATERGEPYVAMLSMEVDPENLHQGSFELDWNEKFVANLVRAGYQMRPDDTDNDIVDRWFQAVCRNVVLETWEQEQAMNPNRVVKTRDIGDGRSEVSGSCMSTATVIQRQPRLSIRMPLLKTMQTWLIWVGRHIRLTWPSAGDADSVKHSRPDFIAQPKVPVLMHAYCAPHVTGCVNKLPMTICL